MLIYAIDDELAPLYLLEQEIKKIIPDATIKTYQDQEKFIEDYKNEKPDIAFLDIEMPERNGIALARELNTIRTEVNIIFVTGYNEYAFDAMKVFASGYIMKPCSATEIKKALGHLRYPIVDKKVVIKTFGNFEIFIEDKVVKFRLNKSKMLLAYLIEKDGAVVSRKEASAVLFEDGDYSRNRQRDLCRIAQWLQEDLAKTFENPDDSVKIVISDNGYRIDKSNIKCDLYEFLKDKNSIAYFGEYMEQYSFGETRKASLYKYAIR